MKIVLSPCIESLSAAAKAARIRGERAAVNRQLKLFDKGLDRKYRAIPNILANTNLFYLTSRGLESDHSRVLISSRRNIAIIYSGPDLDEYHADAWMHLIFEGQGALGEQVKIKRAAFLKAIGRSVSGRDYLWLKNTMIAFVRATFVIQIMDIDGKTNRVIGDHCAFHMLSNFVFEKSTDTYTFMIDPRWKLVFGDNAYSLIDWKKRLEIRPGNVLAKALQRIIATSADRAQKFELDALKLKLNYKSSKSKLKRSLGLAISELERTQIIKVGGFGLLKNGRECLKIMRN